MARSSQHTHYNEILSNVSVEFKSPGCVAEKILPRVLVQHETDVYYEFDKSSFNVPEDERADGAPENESTGGWIEKAYSVKAYGLRDRITKRMKSNSDKGLDLEISVTQRLTQQIQNGLEVRVLGSGGMLRTAANNTASLNVNWTGSTASPRTDVENAKTVVQKACGLVPNVMVMNPEILRKITLCAEYREEFKFVTDIRNADYPTTLYGLKIIVADALKNSAVKGAAPSLGFIMDDDIWIGYVKEGSIGLRDLTYGQIFYTEQYTRKWYDEDTETDIIAVNDLYAPHLIAKECGYLMTSPFTA